LAAGIDTLAATGKISPEAKETAAFLRKFNLLSDLLNSASISASGQKAATSSYNLAERSEQLRVFQEWVQSWKFEDQRDGAKRVPRSKLDFQQGLILTISAVRELLQFLIVQRGYKYVCTRRFGQDCVENLFSELRRDRGGFNSHPEIVKALSTLRLICLGSLLDANKSQNCQDSGGDILLKIGKD
jgi:hypothetical protein